MSDSDVGTEARGREESALLSAWIHFQENRLPQAPEHISIAALVHYLCGTLSIQEAGRIEQALIASRGLRGQLRDTRLRLDALQAGTWEQAASQAKVAGSAGDVARAWQALLAQRLPLTAAAPQNWRERGWERARREVREGIAEAQAAWTAFLAFGEQLKAVLTTPTLAAARGIAESALEYASGFPEGLSLALEGNVLQDGELTVAAYVQDAAGDSSSELNGRTLFLALRSEGAEWPLAPQPIKQDCAEWRLAGLGSALGLPEGPLPASVFAVSLDAARKSQPSASYTLPAEIEEGGNAAPGAILPVEIRGEPRWKNELFSVEVALPLETRLVCPDYYLQLEIAVVPGCWQRLGAWAVKDWDEKPRVLTANCPGSAEISSLFPGLLRAILQPDTS